MGFRKDKQTTRDWSRWLKQNGQMLREIGIPESLLRSEKYWWHFLEHGYDLDSDWEPSCLSKIEAEILLKFLEREYQSGEAWNCISDIKVIARA